MIVTNVHDFHNARRMYIDSLYEDVDGVMLAANGSTWKKSFFVFTPEQALAMVKGSNEVLYQKMLDVTKTTRQQVTDKYKKIHSARLIKIPKETISEISL